MAILAGGLATRLRPITQKVPKCLLPVAGSPFIAHQLRWLQGQGVREVVLCLGFLGEQVQETIGDGAAFGLTVRYSYDGPDLLGTGGALRKAIPLLGDTFFVLYGDSYLQCSLPDIQDAFARNRSPALMTVFRNQDSFDKSNVHFGEGKPLRYDKRAPSPDMTHIDYGLSIVSASAIREFSPVGAFDLGDLYHTLSVAGKIAAYEVHERFFEIGSPQGLSETEDFLTQRSGKMSFSQKHVQEAIEILNRLDVAAIEKMATLLADVKEKNGRLFFLGVGGSAGNCSHAVNDFRKIVGIESYAPTDNVSELTARTNDDGWESVFVEWLKGSRLTNRDALFVLSVGGGNLEKNISPNLVKAIVFAKEVGAKVMGIVGRDGGFTAKSADACVIVPTVNPESVTPHSEAFQGVIWHLLVSHPALKKHQTKWESATK